METLECSFLVSEHWILNNDLIWDSLLLPLHTLVGQFIRQYGYSRMAAHTGLQSGVYKVHYRVQDLEAT